MAKSKRSSRAHRREPIRRLIPPTRPLKVRPAHDDALMPTYAYSPMFGLLAEAPVTLVPLYAVLSTLHQALAGKPVGSCVLSSHQVSGALHRLGFDAEPIAACATICRQTDTFAELSEVGIRGRPPALRPEGTVTGHMVVFTSTFAHLVDATLVQDPTLLQLANQNPVYSVPVLVPVPAGRDALLATQPTIALDERLSAWWDLQPDWTAAMNAVLTGPLSTAAALGALALATDTLAALHALGNSRDLSSLPDLYPRLGALLTGQAQLPPLPPEPPADLLGEW